MATTYKGVKILTAALIYGAAGVTLWFQRTGPAWVQVVDFAEVAAQTLACTAEMAGDGSTNVLWRIPIWEPDWSVTNEWGGHASVTIQDDGPSWGADGTYIFSERNYGSADYSYYFGNPAAQLIGGAFDIYTNSSSALWALIDCGPAGASWSGAGLLGYHGPIAWALYGAGTLGKFAPAWMTITNGTMWEPQRDYPEHRFIHDENGIIQTSSAAPNYYKAWPMTNTVGTTCPARVRHYSPRRLTIQTNAIGATMDLAMIQGIRAYVHQASSDGSFIGPTNAALDYDGVAEFPRVATSAWLRVYETWATNKYATTNGYYSTNGLPPGTTNWITVTNWQPNAGIVATTNELAWLYAVLYRLRDSRHDGSAGTGWIWANTGVGATLDDAYANLAASFPTGAVSVNGPWGGPPANFIRAFTNSGNVNASAVIITNVYRASGLWTGAVKNAEWMLRNDNNAGSYGWPSTTKLVFDNTNGGPPTSNLWHLFDTQANIGTQTVSAVIGDFALPPKPPDAIGTIYGWAVGDCDAILRWTQPACTQDVFDARFP